MNLLGPVPWIRLGLAAVALGAAFGFGWHLGAGRVQGRWNVATLAQDAIVQKQLADNLAKEKGYGRQLQAASDQAVANRAELDRIRALPRAGRLRCTTTDSANPVPAVPGPPSSATPAGGSLPPAGNSGFDPVPAVMTLADQADDVVEKCRDFQNKWPTG